MSFRNRSRRNSLRPVNRIKHVVDVQQAFNAGTKTTNTLVVAKDAPVLGSPNEVQTGATVNGIYLKVEAYATSSAALSNFYMYIMKNPGNNLTTPAPNAVGSDDNKKYIIHQEMVMFQKVTNSNPRTIFNGVVVVPRGYRRFGPGDVLSVTYLAPGTNVEVCHQCHYKEFR